MTGLNLLAGIENWDRAGKIGIWGHSNGGQIALTVLEISQKNTRQCCGRRYLSRFHIQFYIIRTRQMIGEKHCGKKLAEFEKDYDVELYSLTNYLDRIKAPLLIQQGMADEAVPKKWTDDLVKQLKADYGVYPGADHNLAGGWDRAVQGDIDFWSKHW